MEGGVLETGQLAFLSPNKSANAAEWMANWLGVKSGVAKQVREPLLNIKRQADGMLREASVYSMMVKQTELADLLKSIAAKRGEKPHPQDMVRLLEEGMIPQRMSVYTNSVQQQNVLMGSYNNLVSDLTARGYTQADITELLTKASDVSSQLDSFLAVQKATGMDVDTMYNIGMMPRQMTEDGYATAKLAGAIKIQMRWGQLLQLTSHALHGVTSLRTML